MLMKLSELLNEDFRLPSREYGKDALYYTLPGTVELPQITAQDPYLIYRIGMAMAPKDQKIEGGRFNEFSILTYYTKEEEELIQKMLAKSGVQTNKISTTTSEEPVDTNKTSPIVARNPLGKK